MRKKSQDQQKMFRCSAERYIANVQQSVNYGDSNIAPSELPVSI